MSRTGRLRLNSPHVASQVIDGEAVIIHFETGCYYSTDGVGSAIVELVKRHASTDEIVSEVVRRSGSTREDVDAEVTRFVEELKGEQLVTEIVPEVAGDRENDAAPSAATEDDRLAFVPPCLHKYTDLQDLLLLDPIHDTDESGWPAAPQAGRRDGG